MCITDWYLGLEGVDGVGKSATADELQRITGATIFHRHPPIFGYAPAESIGMEYATLKLHADIGFPLIEERTFLGFNIYKNNPHWSEHLSDVMLGLVTKRPYMYVYLHAPIDVLRQRLGDEEIPSLEMDIKKYDRFFQSDAVEYLCHIAVDATYSVEANAKYIAEVMSGKGWTW